MSVEEGVVWGPLSVGEEGVPVGLRVRKLSVHVVGPPVHP